MSSYLMQRKSSIVCIVILYSWEQLLGGMLFGLIGINLSIVFNEFHSAQLRSFVLIEQQLMQIATLLKGVILSQLRSIRSYSLLNSNEEGGEEELYANMFTGQGNAGQRWEDYQKTATLLKGVDPPKKR